MSLLDRIWYGTGRRSVGDVVASAPLLAASGLFSAGVALRNRLYDRGLLEVHRVPGLRIVSLGNLNVGGAGKTPAAMFLAERALQRGIPVAVASRGYGRRSRAILEVQPDTPTTDAGDEPLLLKRRVPTCRVLVGADRVALARRAVEAGTRLLLLDDGFQHRRLTRDLDVLVVDGAAGFGNGRTLPAGPLREPLSGAARAGLIWLREPVADHVSLPNPNLPTIRVRLAPLALLDPSGNVFPANALGAAPVLAFAGLARPANFVRTLDELGLTPEFHAFPDHHAFSSAELAKLELSAAGRPLVTTEKDAMRLPANFPCWVLRVGTELVSGEEHLDLIWPGL